MDGTVEGLAALGLWMLSGAQSQVLGAGTDGLVSRADLVRVILNPTVAEQLAQRLVDVGFWHASGHDCPRCPAVPQGHWLFHDWFDMRYTPAAQASINKAKRQELKDPKLIAQVWARDCIDPADPAVGGCRYCGATLKLKDTRSQKRPHLDHVDPRKVAGIRNVVLACHECNQRKGNRTPQEAGMTLLPPPRPSLSDASEDTPGSGGPVAETGDAAGPSGSGRSRPADPAAPPATSGAATPVEPHSPVRSGRREGRPSEAGDAAGPTMPGTSRPVDPAAPAPDGRPPGDHPPDHSETTLVPAGNQAVRAVPRGRGPGQGQGQGQGVGWGLGKGESSGLPQPTTQPSPGPRKPRRRKRPRSRSRAQPASEDLSPTPGSLDAGLPPPGVQAPANGFGSPWHGWRGPPSPVTSTDCPTHHLPEPCWKCGDEIQENADGPA